VAAHLAAVHERQHQVQLVGRLERKLEVDDERVADLCQHVALGDGVLHLVALHNVGLIHPRIPQAGQGLSGSGSGVRVHAVPFTLRMIFIA
jgi:hypothetical protein